MDKMYCILVALVACNAMPIIKSPLTIEEDSVTMMEGSGEDGGGPPALSTNVFQYNLRDRAGMLQSQTFLPNMRVEHTQMMPKIIFVGGGSGEPPIKLHHPSLRQQQFMATPMVQRAMRRHGNNAVPISLSHDGAASLAQSTRHAPRSHVNTFHTRDASTVIVIESMQINIEMPGGREDPMAAFEQMFAEKYIEALLRSTREGEEEEYEDVDEYDGGEDEEYDDEEVNVSPGPDYPHAEGDYYGANDYEEGEVNRGDVVRPTDYEGETGDTSELIAV